MKIIHTAFAQISASSDENPNGLALEIFFIVEDGAVVITTEQGKPLRDAWGKPVSKKIADGEDARKVAANLGLRNWRSASDPMEDFRRPLSGRDYPPAPC
jgi:hypothetical protein